MERAKTTIAPKGYKLLIALPKISEKIGSLYRPDQNRKDEEIASIMGLVIAMGDTAYKDPARFPNGAWCKEGDAILFKSYVGTRFKIGSQEFRVINDDTVEGVVSEPSIIERA